MLLAALLFATSAPPPAQVAVAPFQRTQYLSPDDALLIQEVVAGLVDESPRFQLVQVSLEDLMSGRVPQFLITGALRQADGGFELELSVKAKGHDQPLNSTVRQGLDLPALATAVEDVLPSLFGVSSRPKDTPKADKPKPEPPAAVAPKAPKTSRIFARSWQPYSAGSGVAMAGAGAALWFISAEDLDGLEAAYESATDSTVKEQARVAFNDAVDRQIAGRQVALGVGITGAVLLGISLIP